MALVMIIIGIVICVLILVFLNRNKGNTRSYYKDEHNSPVFEPIPSSFTDKGIEGEDIVFDAVAGTSRAGAKIIRNCWLRFPNGTITEVDLALIYKTGIYVVESKNYGECWVFGQDGERFWTRTQYNHRTGERYSRRFYNPVEQNYVHIDCIRKLIQDWTVPIYSIVAFSNCCELKKVPESTDRLAVVNYWTLKQAIAQFHIDSDASLSNEAIVDIYQTLIGNSMSITQEEKEAHNNRIKFI